MTRALRHWFNVLSERFNTLPKASRRKLAASVTACLIISLIWMIIALRTTGLSGTQIGTISTPMTQHFNYDNMKREQLIPLGKLKGEVNGQFDSFYVAVDRNARIFINRDIDYGPDAYVQNKKWQEITRTKLAEYERDMTFRAFNQKSKSLKP